MSDVEQAAQENIEMKGSFTADLTVIDAVFK